MTSYKLGKNICKLNNRQKTSICRIYNEILKFSIKIKKIQLENRQNHEETFHQQRYIKLY